MIKRRNKYSPYYQFMEPYFENGDKKIIAEAKREYRRKYKAGWRKFRRRQLKEITISWEKQEHRLLKEEAKRHRESVTRFIKKATIGYMNKRYVVPDEDRVNKVIQLLALIYNSINEMQEEGVMECKCVQTLLQGLEQLERDIRIQLFSPKTVEQVIAEQVKGKPALKVGLIEYLQTL